MVKMSDKFQICERRVYTIDDGDDQDFDASALPSATGLALLKNIGGYPVKQHKYIEIIMSNIRTVVLPIGENV